MASAGSCSTGLRSRPSAGAGRMRSNGFEVDSVNSRKPKLTMPSTPMTRLAKLGRQVAAERRDRQRPQREDPGPQQQRAFVRAPQRGHAIERGQRRVGIAGDVQHREVEGHEGVNQHADGRADQHELPGDRGPHRGHPAQIAAMRARRCRRTPARRQQQREDQRELSELGNHQVLRSRGGRSAAADCP